MDFTPTEEQQFLVQEATQFLADAWPVDQRRRMLGPEAAEAAATLWTRMTELGWPGLRAPEAADGLDATVFEAALLAESMGRRLIPGDFFASAVLAVEALRLFAPDSSLLPSIASGEARATTAVWESGAGYELAVQDGRIAKTRVESAVGADLILALVRTSDQEIRLVRAVEPEVAPQPVLDATRPTASVSFDVSSAETLGVGDAQTFQTFTDLATVFLAAEMTGVAQEALDDTVAYVRERKQFGTPVGAFQAVQHRAAEMLGAIEKSRSAVQHAALVADEAPAELPRAASAAKVCANQAAVFCAEQAIQLHGGIGFTWEQDVHLYLKRAKAAEVTLGDNAFHLDRIARSLGLDAA